MGRITNQVKKVKRTKKIEKITVSAEIGRGGIAVEVMIDIGLETEMMNLNRTKSIEGMKIMIGMKDMTNMTGMTSITDMTGMREMIVEKDSTKVKKGEVTAGLKLVKTY